ncbi:hypothetical protein BBK82_39080 [Lentzea guizhouensis]|uniref:Uncharacterized protein n=1 Tax=Lentzea guizhouensis TaxID=1586287 RepID=A0A1B2HTP6_9PSEU|nr:hypothetical protein BBK82_39080 [Lentzea guizhouensis]
MAFDSSHARSSVHSTRSSQVSSESRMSRADRKPLRSRRKASSMPGRAASRAEVRSGLTVKVVSSTAAIAALLR